jgi:hypothetical protein
MRIYFATSDSNDIPRPARSQPPSAAACFLATGSLNGSTAMARYSTLVRAAPAGGYRWKIIVDGQALRDGTAPTEIEARAAADEAGKLLQQTEHRQA